MNEQELLNALEYCCDHTKPCEGCFLYNVEKCDAILKRECIDVIKRQQEQIEAMKTKDKIWTVIGQGLYDENKSLKAELERMRNESEDDFK